MTDTNSFARSLHDIGLAAWFGGSLMGAVGLNGAAAQAKDPKERARLSTQGWKRWSPVNATAIGAHLLGAGIILRADKKRIAGQEGVATLSTVKTGLTVAALAATAASGYFGGKLAKAEQSAPVSGATEPSSSTPPAVASAQKGLKPLQWAIPLITGAIVVVSARMGEQQKPSEVASGLLSRITG